MRFRLWIGESVLASCLDTLRSAPGYNAAGPSAHPTKMCIRLRALLWAQVGAARWAYSLIRQWCSFEATVFTNHQFLMTECIRIEPQRTQRPQRGSLFLLLSSWQSTPAALWGQSGPTFLHIPIFEFFALFAVKKRALRPTSRRWI